MTAYGIIEAKKENCVGCRMCEIVCSAAKEGKFIPSLARIQVIEDPLQGLSAPIVCFQCVDAMCMRVCPASAIKEKTAGNGDRFIDIDPEKCISCGRCAFACPVGAINYSPAAKARKCDLCGGDPQCVRYCYYDCLHFLRIDAADFKKRARKIDSLISKACRVMADHEMEQRHRQALPKVETIRPDIGPDIGSDKGE
ncbi:MAG: 4Fe-4S dicluster domain-containing protein [Desulfobacteraceae bacterium]|nr:MAG: 4Fe-4S dicluster domain-containing protein [Desulfobacteraceae bacterium]